MEIAQNTKTLKKEKTSKVLWIIGIVTSIICLILTIFWVIVASSFLTAETDEIFGTTLGLIIFIAYFGVPSLFFGAVATILTCLSLIFAKTQRIWKIIILVVTLLALITSIVFFILI